jgi:N-acetyl sugar amidotransferase
MHYCKKCVTPSTRPRITFDKRGICNACNWHNQKKLINWNARWNELENICDQFRKTNGEWDCIIPCSGGKDSSTIAYRFKHELGMNPLTVTFAHPFSTHLGWVNWNNFVQTGFDNVLITPDIEKYKLYAKDYFIRFGMPKQPFVVGISTAIIKLAKRFGIKLICFAEQGELEYGGKTEFIKKFNRSFLTNIYYEGQKDSSKYGPWWEVPTDEDLEDLYVTWMSNFWNWDPEKNAIFAKKHCGMEMLVGGNIGTFTNYSQNEDMLQDLHCFLMFCKYGFGRCTSDASIEIRWDRLSRESAVDIVNRIDGQYPVEHHEADLDYFNMSCIAFLRTIRKHANEDILTYTGKKERPYMLKRKVS